MKVIIEADGGSRGNPGIAGAGAVVYDADRHILREIAYVVGKASNNVAEYHGLVEGLSAAAELGATEVAVFMDSKLVVEQMSGNWKIKHPDMKALATQAQRIARTFDKVTYSWVPREKNKKADELSNVAMDACAAGHQVGIVGGSSPSKLESGTPGETSKEDSLVAGGGADGVAKPASVSTPDAAWHGATMRPTRLILLRHGETAMSVAKQYSGSSDPELSENGRAQAEATATRLASHGGIDLIVASPARRAQQTAQAVADKIGLPVETIEDLRELDFGDWEGKTFGQVQQQDPEFYREWLADTKLAVPGGESVQQVMRRTKKVVDALEKQHRGKNILVVSHVTPIKSILKLALGAPPGVVHRLQLNLASVSIAEFYADGPTLVRLFNDTAHL
ncbi:bifunctional RNase H/acid phosphatase [Corynebacterium epidermidicanis]|uniref:Fructose-2,6-bisphosphatase n=1 Tax=Corynebacterium epidermidicanis TaxID=1050174 RepID=A0A0G3GQW8_9CORY|nr:bifunctional RNase H/acid phosphatase [Corynebacterium epidermidicanis]AKK03601.1 fructose-2,6-bisphosphatase [Corynebacterium epidermidicanis]